MLPAGAVDVARLVADFVAEHVRTYGHGSADDPIDVVSVRALARVERTTLQEVRPACRDPRPPRARERRARRTSARRSGRVETPGLQPRRPPRGRASRPAPRSTRSTPPASCRRAASRGSTPTATSRSRSMAETPSPFPAVDPITLEVVKNALASTADEMALVVMRSAYSPVVRDTMDYSTALCDRNGRVVAQGLTLAVQLGTFPTVMALRAGGVRLDGEARRRLHRERPVRLRRPAPARPLRDPADLRRGRARGLRGDDGPSLRRRRDRAGQRRRARDRDLPGGPADPALEALRRRRREHDPVPADRGEHAAADPRARRPPRPARGLPRRRARPRRRCSSATAPRRTPTWTSCSASPSG